MADQADIAEKHSRGRSLSAGLNRKSRKRRRRKGRIATACALIAGAVTSGSCTSSTSSDLSPNPSRAATSPYDATSLYGVSAVSGGNAWAVGGYREDTSILHWDGTRWSRLTSPNPDSDFNELNGVRAVSATDAWAVGNASGASDTLILHWDGTRWSRVTSPNPDSDFNELNGVSAVSAKDAWAVGEKGGLNHDTLVLHWDGNTWSEVMSPNPNPDRSGLSGVSADSARDAWAVGSWDNSGESEALILHWDGTRWSAMSVHGLSIERAPRRERRLTHGCLGGGYLLPRHAECNQPHAGSSLERYTLVAGQEPEPGLGINTLTGVSAISPTDAWAVGAYRDRENGIGHTLALHWDGTRWSQVKSPNPGSDFSALDSVSAISPKDAWAVGYYQDKAGIHALILHWDGTNWSRADVHRVR